MQILRFSGVVLASIEKLVKGLWKAKMKEVEVCLLLLLFLLFFLDSMGRACKSIKVW